MDSVVHFEIPADDVKRAAPFYKKAFGWDIDQFPGVDYWLLGTTEVDERRTPKNRARSTEGWENGLVP